MTRQQLRKQLKIMLNAHGVKGVDVEALALDVERLSLTVTRTDAQPFFARRTVDTDRRLERLRLALAEIDKDTLQALVSESHGCPGTESAEQEATAAEQFAADCVEYLKTFVAAAQAREETKRKRGGVKQWYPMTFGAMMLFRRRLPEQPISTADTALLPQFVALCYAAKGVEKNPTGLKRRINAAWRMLKHVRPAPGHE